MVERGRERGRGDSGERVRERQREDKGERKREGGRGGRARERETTVVDCWFAKQKMSKGIVV